MQSANRTSVLKGSALLSAGLFLSIISVAQAHTVNATIDTSKTGASISKYIYGQFLEHGGDIVNTGVWSEMLVDRKFFYPVAASAPTPPPVMGNAAGNPRFRRTPTRWWAPIGGGDVVTMDTKAPYTGDQTPLAFVDQYIGNLKQYRAIAMDVGDRDGLRVDAGKLHAVLDNYGIANSFEIYSGTHTSAVADRFQNHVLPFFSKNLCFTADCR